MGDQVPEPLTLALPTGETAVLRTSLKARDKFAVQGVINVSQDGRTQAGILSLMETALLARLIESWSLPDELPSKHACSECTGNSAKWHEHVRDTFGDALDLDDYNALETHIAPLLAKVMAAPNLETPSASGESS
jgi:hypothetical protein